MSASPVLVSIVMPAYNAEAFIEETILSVIHQTYPHWELVIVDDGSTDKTTTIVESINDPRIKLIKSPHLGSVGAVHNVGLKACSGEYIGFLDSDDLYEPESIALRVEYLEKNPNCTAVYGFYRCIDTNGAFIPHMLHRPSLPNTPEKVDVTHYQHNWFDLLVNEIRPFLPGTLIRKEVVATLGPENEDFTFVHDFLYYVKLFQHDFEGVHFIDRYIVRYRQHLNNQTRNQTRFLEALNAIEQYCNLIFDDYNLPPEALACRSKVTAKHYGHLMRSRLWNRDAEQFLQCLIKAKQNPHVKLTDWVVVSLPYIIRFIVPNFVQKWMVQLNNQIRFKR